MFELVGDKENKPFMERYMRNQFSFLGLKTPARKRQSKALIQASKRLPLNDVLAEIEALYRRDNREYQYVAIDMAYANVTRLRMVEIEKLSAYIQIKSWWDTVDTWRKVFGKYVSLHPTEKGKVFDLFYRHPNFWMRRVAITLQLLEKETLDKKIAGSGN